LTIQRKAPKKATKKKVLKRKVTKKKVTKHNPLDYTLPVFESEKGKYIKLSDFKFQFDREIKHLGDRGDYEYGYEINNMVNYNSGIRLLVGFEIIDLITLIRFKELLIKGFKRLDLLDVDSTVDDALNETFGRIPNNVKLIDIEN
jgi:hypothetical protein